MKRYQAIFAATAFLLWCYQLPAARAANIPYSLSVTPFAGGYVFEGNQKLSSEPVYGLAVGYNLSEHWALEGAGSFVLNTVSADSTAKSRNRDVYGIRGDILYHFLPEERLVPYVALGGGAMLFEYQGGGSDTDTMVDYGAGAKFYLTDNIALRADVRHILDINSWDHNTVPDFYNHFAYTAGLTFQLGGVLPAAQPVYEAQPKTVTKIVPSTPPAARSKPVPPPAPTAPKVPAPSPPAAPVPAAVKKAPVAAAVEEEPFTLQVERPNKSRADNIMVTGITVDKDRIDITTTRPVKKFTILTLSQPSRLVIDLYGAGSDLGASRVPINRFGLLAVRFGQHPDHLRIVLDAALEKPIPYQVTKTLTGLRVKISP